MESFSYIFQKQELSNDCEGYVEVRNTPTMGRRPSSLTQEMNLARRACWTQPQNFKQFQRPKEEDSQLLNVFSYVYYLFTTTITLLLQNCMTKNSRRTIISNFSAKNSEKTSVHHLKQIKFSNKFVLINVISCILLSSCVNYCEARPNLSTGANNGVDSGSNPSNVSILFFYLTFSCCS